MWNSKKICCLNCKHEITSSNFVKHNSKCNGLAPTSLTASTKVLTRGSLKCIFCNKEFEHGRQLGGHVVHCKANPNTANCSKSRSPLSIEHKEKISKSRIKFLEENPDEVPYRKYHHSKGRSYPEMLFAAALRKANITGWEQEFRHSIYTYDFAFPNEKLDVEIDGNTHTSDQVKKIDARRDEYADSKGWKVLRFSAKHVLHDVDDVISKLKEVLSPTRCKGSTHSI